MTTMHLVHAQWRQHVSLQITQKERFSQWKLATIEIRNIILLNNIIWISTQNMCVYMCKPFSRSSNPQFNFCCWYSNFFFSGNFFRIFLCCLVYNFQGYHRSEIKYVYIVSKHREYVWIEYLKVQNNLTFFIWWKHNKYYQTPVQTQTHTNLPIITLK